MRLPLAIIPDKIIKKYNLLALKKDGWVHIEIQKGMYGLPQAGFLASKLLKKHLSKHGYFPVQYTPGIWKHTWRPVIFYLVVDDFGVKYTRKDHALHLIKALKNDYKLALD